MEYLKDREILKIETKVDFDEIPIEGVIKSLTIFREEQTLKFSDLIQGIQFDTIYPEWDSRNESYNVLVVYRFETLDEFNTREKRKIQVATLKEHNEPILRQIEELKKKLI